MVTLAAILTASAVFTQELKLSGEVKTGFYWYEKQIGEQDPTSEGFVHNNEDDSGQQILNPSLNKSQGRFRLNMWLNMGNTGMKVRFQQTEWRDSNLPRWDYAFAYGNFLNDQLKLSVGKLGDSPWATGGPEMWKELDTRIGVRAEITPGFLPGLNLGFVLNDMDGQPTQAGTVQTIVSVLQESVLGLAYTNDFFALKFAYRLDSEDDYESGDQLIFRLEERTLNKYLEGFQIWLNGSYEGIRSDSEEELWLVNWLYFQYTPQAFTAQVRFGYDVSFERHILYVRPSFYYNFFNNFLSVGTAFQFAQDFGENKMYKDSPYLYWNVEPMIKANFGNAYAALVYQYRNEYGTKNKDEVTTMQWINLRVVYTF
jgi:hypothetical protein